MLKPGGFIQFSVAHPSSSTPVRRWVEGETGEREALATGRYFFEGPVTETWRFVSVPQAKREEYPPFTITHSRRTISTWINNLVSCGFVIERLGEPFANAATARTRPEVADTRIAPFFLHVRARRS